MRMAWCEIVNDFEAGLGIRVTMSYAEQCSLHMGVLCNGEMSLWLIVWAKVLKAKVLEAKVQHSSTFCFLKVWFEYSQFSACVFL